MSRNTRWTAKPTQLWALIGWLALIFIFGGSARGDTTSLLLLRPLSVFVFAILLLSVDREHLRRGRVMIFFIGAATLLIVLHLLPLPPFMWKALPQRELIANIDDATSLSGVWRPLSIAPSRTWNALFSAFVPLSIALFLMRLEADEWPRLITAILAIAALSCFLGILQIGSGDNSALYFYRFYNAGNPLGLFSNRNHQAVFLATCIPLLAYFASWRGKHDERYRLRLLIAGLGVAFLFLLLLLLGSRAGLLGGLLGLASIPFIFSGRGIGQPELKRRLFIYGGVGVALFAIVALSIITARSVALDRLIDQDNGEAVRSLTFRPILELAWAYMPLGSGIGTFVEAWFRAEPDALLSPRYLNHAHNDLLELFLTGGIPAVVLVLAAAITLLVQSFRYLRRGIREPGVRSIRAGLAGCAILTLASAVDYPLRNPSMMAHAVIIFSLALGMARPDRAPSG